MGIMVQVARSRATFPSSCGCCMADLPEEPSFGSPSYCRACLPHVRARGLRGKLSVAGLFAGGVAAAYAVPAVAPYVAKSVFIAAVVGTGAALAIVLRLVLGRVPSGHRPGIAFAPAWTRCENEDYGRALARSNGRPPVSTGRIQAVMSVLWLAGAGVVALGAMFAWGTNHQTIIVDSSEESDLTIVADGHVVATVPALAFVEVDVPRTAVEIEARIGDRTIEKVDNPKTRGVYVWDVLLKRCYLEHPLLYSASPGVKFGDTTNYEFHPNTSLFLTDADYVFQAPDKISAGDKDDIHKVLLQRSGCVQPPSATEPAR